MDGLTRARALSRGRKLVLPALVCVAALGSPAAASANNRFTLDAAPASPGEVVQDAAGSAYVAWTHSNGANPDTAMFCKIPRGGTCTSPVSLPLPADDIEVSGAFPVLGASGAVNVVAPRHAANDELVYTSANGGATWSGPAATPLVGAGDTNPSNVLRSGSSFDVSSNNVGLGFSDGAHSFHFDAPGDGDVDGSSLALDAANKPVEAYWRNPTSPPYKVAFYRYTGPGPAGVQTNWAGPTIVSDGYESKLAGGASGLFLVSQDYAGGANPSAVNVRKYDGANFEAPVTLANDASAGLFVGGAIAQSPGGHIAVAWPGPRTGDNAFVMRLFTSTDGGASYGIRTDVARLPQDYGVDDNAQLAVGDDGAGWLTFTSVDGGLQVADLTPIAPYIPPGTGGGGTPPPAGYAGPNRTISGSLGHGLSVTLRLPKSCLRSGQAFKAFVGTRIKHKVAHGRHLAVKKVSFAVDGRRAKTLTRGPFTLRTSLTGPPGSRHKVTARVTVRIRHGHHVTTVTKTVKGTVTLC